MDDGGIVAVTTPQIEDVDLDGLMWQQAGKGPESPVVSTLAVLIPLDNIL